MERHESQPKGLVCRAFVVCLILTLALAVPQAPGKQSVSRQSAMAIHDESDPSGEQSCSLMGQLDIAYPIGFGKTPSVGLRVTDPRGRRFGYDPTSGKGWQEMPLAEGFVDCDGIDDAAGPANCTAHIQICGPISGAYTIELIPARSGTYSLSVTAASERNFHVRSTDSRVSDSGLVEAQSPKTLILQYSRVPGSDVELMESAQASGAAWTGLH